MELPLAYTRADLDNLKKAIASGVQQAMQGGEMIQYRSLKEMRQIVSDMERDLGIKSSSKVSYPKTSSGW